MKHRFSQRVFHAKGGLRGYFRCAISPIALIGLSLVMTLYAIGRPAFAGREMTDSAIREIIEERLMNTVAVSDINLAVHVDDGAYGRFEDFLRVDC